MKHLVEIQRAPVAALTDAGGKLGHRVLPTGAAKARFDTNFWSFAAPSTVAGRNKGVH